jgi:folate-dependent tRNA-U54 methylase TrmFO/GidA
MILLDTGDAKLMTSNYPIEKLRRLPGMENARYVDPCAGSKGNSIRYLSIAYRSNTMTVDGISNLLCAGEKSGLFIGHTEAITTGTLAGNNAARLAADKPLLTLPQTLAVGDLIAAANNAVKKRHDTMERFTFSGGNYFKRMNEKHLYTTDIDAIRQRVEQEGLLGVFNEHV